MVNEEKAALSGAGKNIDIEQLAHMLSECGLPVEVSENATIKVELIGGEHIEITPTPNGTVWAMETHIVMASNLSANEIKENVVTCGEISATARAFLLFKTIFTTPNSH